MLRTLTNLFIIPLIYLSYELTLYVDMIIFISTFIGSFLFHLQEEYYHNLYMPYWYWLVFDHYTAMMMVTIVCCHVSTFNDINKLKTIYIVGTIDIFLNLLILHIRDGMILDIKNIIEGLLLFSIIIFNYKKVKLINIYKIYFIISYIFIFGFIRIIPIDISISHSLWHISVFFNTAFLYKSLNNNYMNTLERLESV